jgi:hypothetical protein
MNKGAPNIKIMELWEDTECIINYFISPGIGLQAMSIFNTEVFL